MPVNSTAFVVVSADLGNICRVILRHLWSVLRIWETFAGNFSGVCGRFGRGRLFAAFPVVFCRIVAYALVHLRRCVYM